MRLNFCPYTAGLVIIFFTVFLHTIFLLNEDPTLMAIYESGDPGNLTYGIMSLFAHPVYSQHNYFFFGYGWPFSDISFIVVLLLKVIGQLFGFYNQPWFSTRSRRRCMSRRLASACSRSRSSSEPNWGSTLR